MVFIAEIGQGHGVPAVHSLSSPAQKSVELQRLHHGRVQVKRGSLASSTPASLGTGIIVAGLSGSQGPSPSVPGTIFRNAELSSPSFLLPALSRRTESNSESGHPATALACLSSRGPGHRAQQRSPRVGNFRRIFLLPRFRESAPSSWVLILCSSSRWRIMVFTWWRASCRSLVSWWFRPGPAPSA